MAKHRYVFEFAATAGNAATAGSQAGWTEAWYDPADANEDNAALRAVALKNSRRTLLTPGWSVTDIRIGKLDASNNLTRKGQLIHLPPQGNSGTYILQTTDYDEQPWDAINISINTFGGSKRAFLMRGISTDVVGAGGRFRNPPVWAQAFPLWVGKLTAGANPANVIGGGPLEVALRTRGTVASVLISNVVYAQVANVNLATDATRPLIHVAVNTIQAGNTVSITGVQEMTGVNGIWIAQQVQVDPLNNLKVYVLLAPRRRNMVSGTYKAGGVARYWNWVLDPVSGATVGRGASRRTGRPPQQLRGRRSNRKP